eukprot:7778428-Pyramimonas_sp.AAC.1
MIFYNVITRRITRRQWCELIVSSDLKGRLNGFNFVVFPFLRLSPREVWTTANLHAPGIDKFGISLELSAGIIYASCKRN